MAVYDTMDTIARTIEAFHENVPFISSVEKAVLPALAHTLSPAGVEQLQEGLQVMSLILCNARTVSEEMWQLFPHLLQVCIDEAGDLDPYLAYDHLGYICVTIRNYLAKDAKRSLMQGANQQFTYYQMAMQYIKKCLQPSPKDEQTLDGAVYANMHVRPKGYTTHQLFTMYVGRHMMELLIIILENLHGAIDIELQYIIKIMLDQLQFRFRADKHSQHYRRAILQGLGGCLTYNAQMTLGFGGMEDVFQTWLLSKLEIEDGDDEAMKRRILALASLLRMPE